MPGVKTLLVTLALLLVQPPPPTNVHFVPTAVLQVANLSVVGCFLTYGVDAGGWTTDYPVAMRRVSGARRYFQLSGNGHIYESSEPTLLPCSTVVGSLNVGALLQDWGTFTVNGSDQVPNASGGSVRGLFFDDATGRLVVSHSGTYINLPSGLNTLTILTLGAGTLSTFGCYAPPYTMPKTAGGVIALPSAYVAAHLPTGARWGLTGGIFASATSGNDYGPGLRAIVPPSANACAPGTDNPIAAGTTLAAYAANGSGATCMTDVTSESGSNLGCTPAPTVLTPHPAPMAYSTYSYHLYGEDWDPYGSPRLGYFADDTSWRANWYSDGIKEGFVVPFMQSAGYLKTTIVSTTGPGQVTLASTDTHDGNHLNAGDYIILKTCTVGVDAGCASANANSFSVVQADTVNTATNAVTYHLVSGGADPCTLCTHTPVVGQPAYGGPVYPHGAPGWMRSTEPRFQILDVSAFTSVLGGAASYTPAYREETSLYAMGVTNLGAPASGRGVHAGFGGDQLAITSTIVDPTDQKIIVFVKNAQLFGGTVPRSMGIVLAVAHTP